MSKNTIELNTEDNNDNVTIFPSSDQNAKQAQIAMPLLEALVGNLKSRPLYEINKNLRMKLQKIDNYAEGAQEQFYAILSTELDLKNLVDAMQAQKDNAETVSNEVEPNKSQGAKVLGKMDLSNA